MSASRDVLVAAPLPQALAIVREIELLEPLERKARTVTVHPATAAAAGLGNLRQEPLDMFRTLGEQPRSVPLHTPTAASSDPTS